METLITIPGVELWKVKDGQRDHLVTREWTIFGENATVISKIGSYSWKLESTLHCLKASQGSYVFAVDVENAIYYCLNLPQDASEDDVLVLEATLQECTAYRVDTLQTIPTKTDKFINGLGQATSKAVAGMTGAAHYVGDKLIQGAERYRQRRPACTEPKEFSETTRNRVKKVQQVAAMASGMANAAVDAVTVLTSKAADTILGTINHDNPEKPASNAKRVTAAFIVSAAEIYDGMVDAFSIVSKKTADATKNVVSHKYGEEAGQLTEDGMSAVGHSANAFVQSTRIGSKAILKSTAKKTAIGFATSRTSAPVIRDT